MRELSNVKATSDVNGFQASVGSEIESQNHRQVLYKKHKTIVLYREC